MKQINIEKYDSHDFEGMTQEKWPFTQISNYVVQNIGDPLSGFLWVYLQSLPPTWTINKHHLKAEMGIGEHSYKRAMTYLKKCNLISQYQEKSKSGKYDKSRIIVKNGSKFIHPKDHDNKAMQLNPPINMDVLNNSSTSMDSVPVDKNDNLPIVDFRCTDSTASRKSTSIIKKTDLKNMTKNKKTTTTPTEQVSSSSSICIHELEEYGFKELHAKQLFKICESFDVINSSIRNYREALQNKTFANSKKNKVAYFMGVMREAGQFDPVGKRVLTPQENKVRQQIQNNYDDRYGI